MIKDISSSALNGSPPMLSARAERIAARQEKAIMMAKVARFVLAFYIVLMFKPVLPLVADMMAHTFWEKQHILLVHEVHGKFHIHQELGRAGHSPDSERSNELKYEVEQYFNVPSYYLKVCLQCIAVGTYLSYTYHYPISPCGDAHYPPPRPLA